jgi:serine/threonine protein kinase/Tfp pilus assembly protein PilF
MRESNRSFDPSGEGDAKTQAGGVSIPVKGDSSASNAPPEDMPTLVDAQATSVDADATVGDWIPQRRTPPQRRSVEPQPAVPLFEAGDVVAGRYEILQLLGEGGMGAVYKAQDRELDRPVALKLIRKELAASPSMLARFKQELLLSRQVTHKNVIRIYDLGDSDGVKFITMEFVEGKDLRSLIQEKKKFSPEEAVEIMQQVCQALEAAHSVGVIHRDLKPQNVMREDTGRILVMDFGLARTMEGDGMTQVGALVGTMEYMSPEQALAKSLDQRSDLFTAGLILYELLTGKMPFKAESALASLIKRTQERAAPVSDHDADIPGALSGIVSKCLETDPNLRYQTATELLRDLDSWQGKRAAATLSFHPDVKPWGQTIPWPLLTGIVTVLILAILGYAFRAQLFSSSAKKSSAGPQVSLAIVPFRNASGDSSLDWLGSYLAETLVTDVGQSSSVRTVPSERMRQLLHDLQLTPSSSLDSATVQRVGTSSDAQVVVSGQYVKFGDQIRIEAILQDLKRDRSASLKADAVNQNALPATVDGLAKAIRENLSLSPSMVKELQEQAFKPSSQSLPALRDYNEGLAFARVGNYPEARKLLEASTKADPEFALAYARLSEVYAVLGFDKQSDQASRQAVTLSQSLPAPEKYRIAASHLEILRNYPKAVEAYEELAKATPNDTDVQSALGRLYMRSGTYDKARALYGRLLENDPKSADALFGLGQVEVMGGNPQTALDYLNRSLTVAIQSENDEGKALILYVAGFAYMKLNKPDEAMRNYQESLAIARRLDEKATMARDLTALGQTQFGLGKSDVALKNYGDALKLRREIGDRKGIGDTLIDLGNVYNERGQSDLAMQQYKESLLVQRDLGDEASQAICLSNIGDAYSDRGDYQEALTFYQQALQLREKLKVPADLAETVHNLGDTALRMGHLDQALTQYLRALDLYRSVSDNRNAATESHSTAEVFEEQGRFGPALNAEDEALKVFRGLSDRSFWMGDILSGHANALILAGRGDESQKELEEALSLAREIKSEPLIAQVLNYQGNRFFYAGDLKSAAVQYQEALLTASRTTDHYKMLVAKLNLAKVAVAKGDSQGAIQALKALVSQADSSGLQYFSLECTIHMAQALISAKDYSLAQTKLRDALDKSDKLGARMLLARSHFLLANALRFSGNASEAGGHYREVVRLLDEMSKERGADKVMDRADLKQIYQESTQRSQAVDAKVTQ